MVVQAARPMEAASAVEALAALAGDPVVEEVREVVQVRRWSLQLG